jgi:H/ACA ribonucleoprotein complex subunit 2
VKEVVKALRKSETSKPSSSATKNPLGVVIIAADISPMDVISHIPVLCEDHNIPYIYVRSRAELGSAAGTKRPTSVVMISRTTTAKNASDPGEEYMDIYKDIVKLVNKAAETVKV